MHETSARTWCTGKTERDRVEREVGGGIGMGNTCKPMAVSFQCMTKPTTIKKIKKKDWCWNWGSNTLATWCEELTHWKKPWCWKRLKAGEGGDRGWDGQMASPTWWTWAWVSSGSWWWTGKPGMLQSMGSQRVGHDRVTELNWRGREKGLLRERNQYSWISDSDHKQSS